MLNAIGQDDKNFIDHFLGIDVMSCRLIYTKSIRSYLITDDGITFVGYVILVAFGVIYGGIVTIVLDYYEETQQ